MPFHPGAHHFPDTVVMGQGTAMCFDLVNHVSLEFAFSGKPCILARLSELAIMLSDKPLEINGFSKRTPMS